MDFSWEDEYVEFRQALREFIAERRTPELLEEYARTYGGGGELIRAFHEAIHERGWMRMCWPKEYGGEGRDMLYQYIFVEEMEYWGESDTPIKPGQRNHALTRFAGVLFNGGCTRDEMMPALMARNERLCDPPIEAKEIQCIVASAMRNFHR